MEPFGPVATVMSYDTIDEAVVTVPHRMAASSDKAVPTSGAELRQLYVDSKHHRKAVKEVDDLLERHREADAASGSGSGSGSDSD